MTTRSSRLLRRRRGRSSAAARVLRITAVAGLATLAANSARAQSIEPVALAVGETIEIPGSLDAGDATLDDGSHADVHLIAPAGGRLVVEMRSGGFDTYLILSGIRADGTPRWSVEDDDGGDGTDSRLAGRVTEGAVLRVLANSSLAAATGAYTLRISLEPDPAEAAPGDVALNDLGWAAEQEQAFLRLMRAGRLEDAVIPSLRLTNFRLEVLGRSHPLTVLSLELSARTLQRAGREAESEAFHLAAVEERRNAQGDEHPDTLRVMASYAQLMRDLDRPADAEPWLRRVVDIRARTMPDDPENAQWAGALGRVLRALGRPVEAEPFYRRAAEDRRRLLGLRHPDALSAAGDLGVVLSDLGRLTEAERWHREVLEGYRVTLGPEDDGTLTAQSNLGTVLRDLGRFDEAEPLLRGARDVLRARHGDDDPRTVTAISNYGVLLSDRGRLAEAEPWYLEVLAIRRRTLGEDHPDTLQSISNHAVLLSSLGRPVEAEAAARRVVELRRARLGDDHPDTILAISNHASMLRTMGRLADAERLSLEAVERARAILGDEHPRTLVALGNHAGTLSDLGRPREAEAVSRESMELSRRVLGAGHPRAIQSVSNHGTLLIELGRIRAAEPVLRSALEGFAEALGPEHANTLSAMANLASVLGQLGQTAEAEALSRAALESRRRILGPEHPDTLTSMAGYAAVLESMGRTHEAESYTLEVIDRRARLLGPEHPATLRELGNHGYLLIRLGRLEEAEARLRSVVDARTRVLGVEHPETLISINNHAAVLQDLGRNDEAEVAYRRVLDGRRRVLGAEHPECFLVMHNLASLAARRGQLPAAAEQHAAALAGVQRTLGRDHPDALPVISALAGVFERLDRLPEAQALWREHLDVSIARRDASPGDERVRSAVAERLGVRRIGVRLARLALLVDEDPAAAFDLLERGRGRTLLDLIARSEENLVRVLRRQAPLVAGAYVDALAAEGEARDRLRVAEAAADAAARAGDDEGRRRQADAAEVARADLGRATFAVFELLRDHLRETAPTPAAAARAFLEPGVVLLSVAGSGDAGVVIGLSRETTVGHVVDEAIAWGRGLGQLRAAAADGADADVAGALAGLRAAMLSPELEALLGEATRIVVMPSPALAGVPFELILPKKQITYASSASVYFDRLDAAAELVPGRDVRLVAAGDPDFSGLTALLAVAEPAADADTASFARTETLRSAGRDQLRSFGGTLVPLPGTRAEVRTIQAVAEAAGVEVRQLLGRAASVPALRELVERAEPRYLHLATHGFPGTSERPYTASLALTAPLTPAAGDTGFLTLDDLIQDWFGLLDETDLVVLSACDTAVGVARGDSDMALPWGFYFAGTPTVICSLWEVDDAATALLMGRLYENLLGGQSDGRTVWGRSYAAGSAMPKSDALDEAKAWLRGLTRDAARAALNAIGLTDQPLPRGLGLGGAGGDARPDDVPGPPYADPRYWAAFTLRGSPR